MGNKTVRSYSLGKDEDFVSSLDGDHLRLTTSETAKRVSKKSHDVVKDEEVIKAIMSCQDQSLCRILIMGKAGVGKSALINSISGADLALESHKRQCGCAVEVYKLTVSEYRIVIVESPGVFDGNEREEGHVIDLQSVITSPSELQLVMFCWPIISHCFTEEDHKTLHLFTNTLGKEIWNKSVIVLTFANRLVSDLTSTSCSDPVVFAELLQQKIIQSTTQIKAALRKLGILEEVIQSIPVSVAGYHKASLCIQKGYILPDDSDWLYKLWEKISKRVDKKYKHVFDAFENERFVPFGFISIDESPETVNV